MSFEKLGLSEKTIRAINEFGIKKPTTVQMDVIPSILQGKDVFTIAPQKCGKTASYIFPLVDIISRKEKQNILIITPSSKESVEISDCLSIFNKYHEINEATLQDVDEDISDEANVIIASPELLAEIVEDEKIDLSTTDILVVDDINLIKKNKQLDNLRKILEVLPADKQNIVYTNRRSKETQEILDKILKAPEEIKVGKDVEDEVSEIAVVTETVSVKPAEEAKKQERPKREEKPKKEATKQEEKREKPIAEKSPSKKTNERRAKPAPRSFIENDDDEALELAKKYKSFGGKVPKFIFNKSEIVDID